MQRLPNAITAGGKTRRVTAHLQQRAINRPELTEEYLIAVLETWVVRGIGTDNRGRPAVNYLGWVENQDEIRLMRVIVSMDDQRIVTAHLDRQAMGRLLKEGWNRVAEDLTDVEFRN